MSSQFSSSSPEAAVPARRKGALLPKDCMWSGREAGGGGHVRGPARIGAEAISRVQSQARAKPQSMPKQRALLRAAAREQRALMRASHQDREGVFESGEAAQMSTPAEAEPSGDLNQLGLAYPSHVCGPDCSLHAVRAQAPDLPIASCDQRCMPRVSMDCKPHGR